MFQRIMMSPRIINDSLHQTCAAQVREQVGSRSTRNQDTLIEGASLYMVHFNVFFQILNGIGSEDG